MFFQGYTYGFEQIGATLNSITVEAVTDTVGVPEPASMLLLGSGLIATLVARRRRQ